MKSSLQIWISAARPKTLPLALVSIVTGSALAFAHGHFSWSVALLAFLTATLLQILSNLANDYGDAVKGTDNEQRLGPTRAMQSGAVSQKTMQIAIAFNVVLTIIAGLSLLLHALSSWHNILIFIALGALAILAAIAYTMGSKPYGYLGLGDVSVFIFFGLLGVYGTYFLHTGEVSTALLLPSIGCGLLAVAVLNINNMRDIENDAECGKRTLAVRLGFERAKRYHSALLIFAWLGFWSYLISTHTPVLLSLAMLISMGVLTQHARIVNAAKKPAQIAPLMPQIVKCALISNLVFATIVIAQTLMS